MDAEKLLRRFQRKLSEPELQWRCDSTKTIIAQLRQDPEWKDWITGVILFGSTARGDARTGSDVDVAILTKQSFFFGGDYPWNTNRLRERIIEIQNNLGIRGLKISPQILAEKWLADPQSSQVTIPAVIEKIRDEGKQIS